MTVPCQRCGLPCIVAAPEALLRSVLCADCLRIPEVGDFAIAERQWHQADRARADAARMRFEARKLRLERDERQRLARLAERSEVAAGDANDLPDHIRAALQRARSRTPAKR